MVKVDRTTSSTAEYIKISTDCHWTDIISIIKYNDEQKPIVSYSSGGTINNPNPLKLAIAMSEAWAKAVEILEEKTS